MPILGTLADVAARLYCRISGLSRASRWSARVLRKASDTSCVVREGESEYRFVASSPILLWRARTLLSKEPETISWLKEFGEQDVLFDIGANVGLYTVYAARRGARVCAFEPESANFALLNRNLSINGVAARAIAYPLAVSDGTRLDTLRLSRLEPGAALHAFGANVDQKGEVFRPAFEQGCLSVSIDELVHRFGLPQPTRIKIDVDGLERLIIAGAGRVLANPRLKDVLIEINEADPADLEMIRALGAQGFAVKARGEPVLAGQARMRNFILARA